MQIYLYMKQFKIRYLSATLISYYILGTYSLKTTVITDMIVKLFNRLDNDENLS